MAENVKFAGNNEKMRAVGTLLLTDGKYYIKSLGGDTLPVNDYFPSPCHTGDRVVGELGTDGKYTVSMSLGSAKEAEANYKAILASEGLDEGFSLDAVTQAKETTFTELTALMGQRADLRGKTILTMSKSEKSRAECGFSVERDKAGNFILGLHTVDAAEFIPEGSPLEKTVFSRGKTVVLPDKEIPMLPDAICKGPCFLEVGEDRLAVSYLLTINGEGKVVDFDFCESIIKTAANCLFDEIEALLFNFDLSAIIPLRQSYASVASTLGDMFALGGVLQNARVARGGADIDRASRQFISTLHSDKAIDVVARKDSDPERLLREFLAVAGIELGAYFDRNGIPAIYRVQAAPDKEAVDGFRQMAEALGIRTADVGDEALMSYAAEYSHGMRCEELLLDALHGALPKKGFSDKPMRHIVHGTDMYVRFAYPINRCADFCIQRIVKTLIAAREGKGELDKAKLQNIVERGIQTATYCEARASRVEDMIEDITAMECLGRMTAKTYTGLVKAINGKELEVLLDNGCVVTAYAEEGQLRYGDSVRVNLTDVDYESIKLYAKLV